MRFKSYLTEMAYPVSFNMGDFKALKSYKEKEKYAQERLLGKLGKGSSRAVFKIDDEKCLKVAVNAKGIAQNSSEADMSKQDYEVVAKVFDSDRDDFWLEMELAKKVTPARFKKDLGFTLEELQAHFIYMKNGNKWISKDRLEELRDNEFIQNLEHFAMDYDYVIPGDFVRASSYGEVLRNGKPTIVVIDYGFTNDVSDTYYKRS